MAVKDPVSNFVKIALQGVPLSNRDETLKIRKAARLLDTEIASLLSEQEGKEDVDYLIPFLAYAYHHVPFSTPKEKTPSLGKFPIEKMAELIPEGDSQTTLENSVRAVVNSVPMTSHSKVAKQLSAFDLSDAEFLLVLKELCTLTEKRYFWLRDILPQELLDFAGRLTSSKRPVIYVIGDAFIRPAFHGGVIPARLMISDKTSAFWARVTQCAAGLEGDVTWNIEAWENRLIEDENYLDFTITTSFNYSRESWVWHLEKNSAKRGSFFPMDPERRASEHFVKDLASIVSFPISMTSGKKVETLFAFWSDKAGDVRFFDSTAFWDGAQSADRFDSASAAKALTSGHEEFTVDVSPDQWLRAEYALQPSRYLLQQHLVPPPGYSRIPLKSVRCERPHDAKLPTEGGHVCSIEDVRKFSGQTLSSTEFPMRQDDASSEGGSNARNYRRVGGDCLLLSAIGTEAQTSAIIFRFSGTPIYITPTVTPIIVEDPADLYWMLDAVAQEYVTQQIKVLGRTLRSLSSFDSDAYDEIILFKPRSSDEEAYSARASADLKAVIPIEERIRTVRREFEDGLKIKKHVLAQPFGALKSRLSVIQTFIQKHETVSGDSIIIRSRNCTLEDYLREGMNECAELGSLIHSLTEKTELGSPAPQGVLTLLDVIRDEHGHDQRFKLELPDVGGSQEWVACIALEDFKEAILNVIQNACAHGFSGMKPEECRIAIDLEDVSSAELCFRIRNNGAPFPEGMTTRRFILKSETGSSSRGTGFGGFRIHQIMQHAGGRVDVYEGDVEFDAGVLLFFRKEL